MSRGISALLSLTGAPRLRLAVAAALGAATVAFAMGLSATAGYLISRAAERPPVLSLLVAIVAVRVFGLGRPILRYLERLRSHDLALRVLGSVRARSYARIEPLAPGQLDAYREGDLLARMVADVDALQNLYLRGLEPPLVALLAGAISVVVAVVILPAAGVVLAVGLLASAVLTPALTGLIGARAARRQAAARGELSAELVELLEGAPELVAYGREHAALQRVREVNGTLVNLSRRDALAAGLAEALTVVFTGLTVAAVLAVAVSASSSGALNPVLIAALALLALASFEAILPLAQAAKELSATLAAGRRVLELTELEPLVRDPPGLAPVPRWPFAVGLEHVSARYMGQPRLAVEDFSLDLEPGEKVALVGPSGVGKTTVVNMLLRFLDPESGCVTIGGRDLREYDQDDVRAVIAVAGQESHLFSASIRDNVRLVGPDASDWEVEHALRQARIWQWVRALPDGLDTFVGEQGKELSGGQQQRIVLARALLARTPVLILDEPTAHLDPATADDLVRDVFSAAQGRTVLLITHRTEGLDLVDRVVDLRPVGDGSPAFTAG